MRGTLALVLSACLTLAQAFQLPSDAADGLYIVETLDNGVHNVTFSEPATQSAKLAARGASLAPRQLPDDFAKGCDGKAVVSDDLDIVKDMLSYWCDNGGRIARRGRAIFKNRNVIAYACTYSLQETQTDPTTGKVTFKFPNHKFTCNSGEVTVAFGHIREDCPLSEHGGFYYVQSQERTFGYGESHVNVCPTLP